MRMRHAMLAGVAALALLTACQDDGGEAAVDAGDATTPTTSSVQTEGPGGDGGEGGEPASDAPLPADQPNLDLEQRHPNGTVLRVTGISFTQSAMTVSVEAVNGYVEPIKLNDIDMQLVDDLQNVYNFVPPEQNPDLRVDSGGTLTGDLTFLGRLDREATSLRLVVNSYDVEPVVIEDEYDKDQNPSFDIGDLPLDRS
jgi:hypothetical protein